MSQISHELCSWNTIQQITITLRQCLEISAYLAQKIWSMPTTKSRSVNRQVLQILEQLEI